MLKMLSTTIILILTTITGGCTTLPEKKDLAGAGELKAALTPRASSYEELISLPPPKGKLVVAVYNFRDQTGQYKPAPASTFSTAVSQGGTAMLNQALDESGWFITLERESLQNLLTERKISRASLEKQQGQSADIPPLLVANLLLEGGITAYDTNIQTGGAGARYFGIGTSEQYRTDQVTVNLRAVDIRTGRILNTVSTTKTIFSQEVKADVFRFIEFKRLLEMEAGYTRNEPAQLCLMSAIETAVIHLITQGIRKKHWALSDASTIQHPVIKSYLNEEIVVMDID
ncbi:CsgG/HfaB family protein [Oceanospirillum sediminis]|uniref:Curli production assembly/transport component CsgG n=1 Tax=Oceanospirillum sediminis TaxID=2760088 RepID=A0A839IMM7_9GAMM|nr:CsgG/HfaB family protein [Oceanospirillum sediminis]MBB1486151.1 curli production assembly/transport protein CsgG [Oceanospirillum sediminis]